MHHLPPLARLALASLTMLAFLAAGCGRPAASPAVSSAGAGAAPAVGAGRPLSLGLSYWPGFFWIDVARDKDWFREAGVAVTFVDTNANFFGSLQDVVDGRLDFQGLTLFDVILFNSKGADLAMIVCEDQSAGADGLIVRPGLDRLAELRGKRIALGKHTYSDYICTTLLQREGIGADEFTRVDVGGEKAPGEIAAGRADAAVSWEPYLGEMVKKGAARKLWDSSQLPGISPAGLTARRALLEERAADVQKIVRIWRRATEFMQDHPDEAFAIVARLNKKTPADVREFVQLDRVLSFEENRKAFSYVAGFDSLHGTARVMNDFLLKQKVTTRRLDSTRYLDARFLKALE